MNSAEGIFLGAGATAYVGSFVKSGGFPPNGLPIIIGTTGLMIFASFAGNGPIAEPVKWLAILSLIAALVKFVPVYTSNAKNSTLTKKKVK